MKKIVNFYKKNIKKLILLQVALCVLLIMIISCLSRNKREVEFNESSLLGGSISEEGYACIDESDETYGIILDTTTGEVKRGWYKVRVEYETGYDDNGFIVQALRPGNVLNEDIGNEERTIPLMAYHDSQEVHAWLKKDSDLRIAIHFCGGGYLQIKRIMLWQIPNYTPVFLVMLCLLFVNIELYEMDHLSAAEVKRRIFVRCGIACIVLLGSIPLMNDYVMHGHDYRSHLYRIEGIAEGLKAGQFPVKIMPNWWNEYGYAQSIFYGDTLLYFPALLTLLDYSIQTAYKCYIVSINLLTAGIAYKCFLKISKDDKIALLGAFLYSLNIYRLLDIYVRCAIGEYTAIAFLPLIVLGIYFIEKEGWVYLTLGLSGCIQSHILSCEMIIFFLILFCLLKIKWVLKRQVFFQLSKAGVATVLWNLWFIVPFLDVYTGGSYKIHFNEIAWKMEDKGVPVLTIFKMFFDGFSEKYYTIGLPLVLGGVLAYISLLVYRKKGVVNPIDKEQRNLIGMCLLMMLIAVVLSTNLVPYSKIGSIHIIIEKLINTLQFPFRFMALASVLAVTALVGAFSLWKAEREIYKEKHIKIWGYSMAVMFIVLIIGELAVSYGKLLTNSIMTQNFEYYAARYIIETTEYLPTNADVNDVSHELMISSEDIIISDYEKEYTNIVMTCVNDGIEEGYVDVPLFYYPCYKAKDKLTGELLSLTYGENSRIRIILPPLYQGKIVLQVSERKLWRIAEMISVLSIVVAFYWIVRKRKIEDIINKKGKQNL